MTLPPLEPYFLQVLAPHARGCFVDADMILARFLVDYSGVDIDTPLFYAALDDFCANRLGCFGAQEPSPRRKGGWVMRYYDLSFSDLLL